MKKIKNLKIKTKIIILCVTVMLINSAVSGKLYYNHAFRDTLNNFNESSQDIANQMNYHMADRFKAITSKVYALANNMSFFVPLIAYINNPDSVNYAKLLGDTADSISELQQSDKYIHSVYIYTSNGSFDNFTRMRRHEFSFESSEMYQFFQDNPNVTIKWFPAMASPIYQGNEQIIPIVYKFKYERQYIYIVISLQQSQIVDYLDETYSLYDEIFIVDGDGKSIANFDSSDADVLGMIGKQDLGDKKSIYKEINNHGEKYVATYTQMKNNGWQIYCLKSTKSLLGNLEQLRYYIIIILAISLLLGIIVIICFANTITNPLNQFVNIMKNATKNEFNVQFTYPYENEVGNLAKSFNYMIREMDSLVAKLNIHIEALKEEKDNVRYVQTQKRKAELKALQAQINPHFLYNTLNAITWQAADQGATEISILSQSLGRFFRISLSKGREIITIREELEHVQSYLNIQKIRYKSKINYKIDVPDDLKELYIIKLVLQPLVENAIYHGIKLKETEGFITITVCKQAEANDFPAIKICVEDNGYGIEKESLETINESLSSCIIDRETGYGIYNVNERIKLYYGDAYGLMLESKFRQWTRSTIIIPVQTTEGE